MRRARHLLLLVPFLLLTVACQDGGLLSPDGDDAGPTASADRTGSTVSLDDCDLSVPDDASTVQGAVDAASEGATVCVNGGTYREQVVVDKDLRLVGFDGATIESPDDPADYTIVESAGSTWEPTVFAYGGSASGGAVSGSGTVQVDVRGLTVDGRGLQAAGVRKVGILYRSAEGTIASNTVQDMGVGGGQTFGILAYGDSDVTIAGNTVDGYERGGIGANGDGGAHPSPRAVITDNVVVGSGDGSQVAWGPNGIQIGFGASGKILDNDVERNRWSSSGPTASCIIVFESDDVQVKRNEVSDCDTGLSLGSWAWFAPSADNVKMEHNSVSGALFGAYVEVVAWEGFSENDPSVTNAKITNNDLDGGSIGVVGIQVAAFDADPDFDPVAENNKIVGNRIVDFTTAVADGGSATKQQANVIQP